MNYNRDITGKLVPIKDITHEEIYSFKKNHVNPSVKEPNAVKYEKDVIYNYVNYKLEPSRFYVFLDKNIHTPPDWRNEDPASFNLDKDFIKLNFITFEEFRDKKLQKLIN